jgi:hypothetical protein
MVFKYIKVYRKQTEDFSNKLLFNGTERVEEKKRVHEFLKQKRNNEKYVSFFLVQRV